MVQGLGRWQGLMHRGAGNPQIPNDAAHTPAAKEAPRADSSRVTILRSPFASLEGRPFPPVVEQ